MQDSFPIKMVDGLYTIQNNRIIIICVILHTMGRTV